jgi:hypothetical protein
MLLIECLTEQRFDNGLAANVQLSCRLIEFLKHWLSKVDVDALNRRHHLAFAGEEARDTLAGVG